MSTASNLDALLVEIDGQQGIWLTRTISDDLPARVREGLARRRITVTIGACPCGARPTIVTRIEKPRRRRGRGRRKARPKLIDYLAIHHADGCPADDPEVKAYLRAWSTAT